MNDDNTEILKEIAHKLDQLIILWKLNNREVLEKFKEEITNDKVYSKILEYADGSLSYLELSKKVADETKSAEITVKRKLSALKDYGMLIAKRSGKNVYYENSGLFD